MTTPQPNPTDDLEAVGPGPIYTIALESLRIGTPGLSDKMRQTVARQIAMKINLHLASLRPAGVGEAVAWRWRLRPGAMFGADVMDWCYGDKNPQISHPMWDVQPLYATPPHPDAALMERVESGINRIANRCIRPVSRSEIRDMCKSLTEPRP